MAFDEMVSIRAPAHADIKPQELAWRRLDDELLEWLRPLENRFPGVLEGVLSREDGRPAYVRGNAPNSRFFAKILPSGVCLATEREVARLVQMLEKMGVFTSRYLMRLDLSGGYAAFVYSWVDGRHPRAEPSDMAGIGEALARLHTGLRDIEGDFSIRSRTSQRMSLLKDYASTPEFCAFWDGLGLLDFACRVREGFLRVNEQMLSAAGVCHGDLNPGNLLVSPEGRVAIIDFEDALHTAVWRGLDLAKLVERLVLPAASTPEELEALVFSLVSSYSKEIGEDVDVYLPGAGLLSGAMRWHLGVSVITLARNGALSPAVVLPEAAKFRQVEGLIARFESGF